MWRKLDEGENNMKGSTVWVREGIVGVKKYYQTIHVMLNVSIIKNYWLLMLILSMKNKSDRAQAFITIGQGRLRYCGKKFKMY